MRRGLASCPWCPWTATIVAETTEAIVKQATPIIEAHNAAAGHEVKPGAKPRLGYRNGRPVQ
jgi:hypothetical protein